MACKDGFCQEEGDGDSDVPRRFYSDPLLLFLFGDLVSPLLPPPHTVSVHGAETSCSDQRGLSFSALNLWYPLFLKFLV